MPRPTNTAGASCGSTLAPYVIGQPFRIKSLETILKRIVKKKGVWAATGSEIVAAWKAQQ